MIKVAILLRGQPRFAKEGAELFDKFIKKNHPGVEFKIFAHSWDSLSRRMVNVDEESTMQERQVYDKVSRDELEAGINAWNPTKTIIETEQECFRLAGSILYSNIKNNSDTYDWFIKYADQQGIDIVDPKYGNLCFLLPEGLTMDKHFDLGKVLYNRGQLTNELLAQAYSEQIRLTYLLGQMFSAGKSLKLLQDCINESDYIPDIVISTRYDSFFWVNSFPKLLYEIKRSVLPEQPYVMSKLVQSIGGRPVIDDYAFVSNIQGMIALLSDIRQRLFDAFTADIIPMFSIIGAGSHLQHLLWAKIGDNNLAFIQPATQHWGVNVLRPGCFDMSLIKHGNEAEFNTMSSTIVKTYKYPVKAEDMDYKQIIKLWERYANGK